MTAAAPSGVVTFLFTDVEGSTRRWEADADGMRVALAAHDEVLRAAIEAHGGWLFKHTGDGVCAAFASPRSAVDAAVAAQRELELPVRMGLATGEAELRDGGLLRCGAQSCRAGDGRRTRWSDPAGRVDGGSAQRSGSASIWGRDGCGMCRRRSGCSRSERRACGRTFRRCGRWIRVRGTCGLRPPASSGASPRSPRCKRRCRHIGW